MPLFRHLLTDGHTEDDVGRFTQQFTVANHKDRLKAELGVMPPEEVRSAELAGWIDTGAAHLILPEVVGDSLGLEDHGKMRVRVADGSVSVRRRVKNVFVELAGRTGVFSAVLLPGIADALIGAILLEEMDLLVAPLNCAIVPRDPETATSTLLSVY